MKVRPCILCAENIGYYDLYYLVKCFIGLLCMSDPSHRIGTTLNVRLVSVCNKYLYILGLEKENCS